VTVARWFQPAHPTVPSLYGHLDSAAVDAFARRWPESIGRGGGLTPYDDDVVCGGLVALSAAGHPAATVIARDIDRTPLEQRTTATSAALLRLAARGYCIDPLARFLADPTPALRAALAAVGHSSGRGLIEGVQLLLGAGAARWAA
jgi:hypothetical protein